jgi:hypothetical protein
MDVLLNENLLVNALKYKKISKARAPKEFKLLVAWCQVLIGPEKVLKLIGNRSNKNIALKFKHQGCATIVQIRVVERRVVISEQGKCKCHKRASESFNEVLKNLNYWLEGTKSKLSKKFLQSAMNIDKTRKQKKVLKFADIKNVKSKIENDIWKQLAHVFSIGK